MIDYKASFTNTDGVNFPATAAINASGAGATDGTEFVKIMIDDEWGARQALMDYAGLTPDTVTEAAGASQALDALLLIAGGPGEVVQYMKNSDPSVSGDRVLLLNGQGVLRASFPELDAAVYVGDSDNPTASAFYRADNSDGSSRNIVGIYLILPETRGYAPRGLDVAASVDPDGASRDLGSLQVDAMQRITGDFTSKRFNGGGSLLASSTGVFNIDTGGASGAISGTGTENLHIVEFNSNDSTSPNAAKTDDDESRMTNFATTFGIRY